MSAASSSGVTAGSLVSAHEGAPTLPSYTRRRPSRPEESIIPTRTPHSPRRPRTLLLLGPAFVAAIAYVDPGNVAANITAGARHGHLLVWVLVCANVAAMFVQYLSAKLGLVTGRSLPALLGRRLPRWARLTYWAQAEIVAAATDLAEVIGGALALHLLLGMPLVVGGALIGALSLLLLVARDQRGQRVFEALVVALLVVITAGFLFGLLLAPPSWSEVAGGLVPRLDGTDSVVIAASMLGATVMPHAVYLHSSLVVDRHSPPPHEGGADASATARLLRATRIDIGWALGLAGLVNIGLLLLAATALRGVEGTDTIEGAHAAIASALGPVAAVLFAIGLLASGLASTSVGAYAGSEIMEGLLTVRVPLVVRRLVTLVPALVVLAAGVEPTWALVVSQVLLSFGIPAALVPLVTLTGKDEVMGPFRNRIATRLCAGVVVAAIIALNVALIVLLLMGEG